MNRKTLLLIALLFSSLLIGPAHAYFGSGFEVGAKSEILRLRSGQLRNPKSEITLVASLSTTPSEASPFGFLPASVDHPDYDYPPFADAQNIVVRWHRPAVGAFWFLIQPDVTNPTYDWSLHDQQYGSVPAGIHILANISADHWLLQHGYMEPSSYRPIDEAKYVAFVQATVDRYNGDGDANDMPGLTNPIKYWQVDNEPKAELSGFADLQRITYQAIKAACPDCTVLIGGSAGFPENYVQEFYEVYGPILSELAGQYVDAFDFHWYGTADGEYRLRDTATGEDVYNHVRAALTASGFSPDLPIWITEMGSYSGDPAEPRFPFQTEWQQAGDYFKRYIYALSRGVQKVFAAFGLMEGFGPTEDGYFDHTGLIYDGRGSNDPGIVGVKKLGYYTYKKMTEMLEGADWSTLTTLHDGTDSDHLYLFRVEKAGRPIHIAWWDTFDEPGYTPGDTKPISLIGLTGTAVTVTTVVPSADTGQEVTDYATAFSVATYPVADGSVTIPLGEDRVLVDETVPPASQCVQDVNANGVGDVVDIQATATELPCHVYLPIVVANWRRPWNLIRNPGFEDGFEGWTPSLYPPGLRPRGPPGPEGSDAEATIVTEGCRSGNCLRMQHNTSTWQGARQEIGPLLPGGVYELAAWFKTAPRHYGYINLHDPDWKDAQCRRDGRSFTVRLQGTGAWQRIRKLIRVPETDDCGASTADHEWRVYLYGHNPPTDNSPITYDDVVLTSGAGNRLVNPSFEDGLTGWTARYYVPPFQVRGTTRIDDGAWHTVGLVYGVRPPLAAAVRGRAAGSRGQRGSGGLRGVRHLHHRRPLAHGLHGQLPGLPGRPLRRRPGAERNPGGAVPHQPAPYAAPERCRRVRDHGGWAVLSRLPHCSLRARRR